MPIYSFECEHEHETEHICRIADRPETVPCEQCGKSARRVMPRSRVEKWEGDYWDENLVPSGSSSPGVLVTSPEHRRKLLNRCNLYDTGPTERQKERLRFRGRVSVGG